MRGLGDSTFFSWIFHPTRRVMRMPHVWLQLPSSDRVRVDDVHVSYHLVIDVKRIAGASPSTQLYRGTDDRYDLFNGVRLDRAGIRDGDTLLFVHNGPSRIVQWPHASMGAHSPRPPLHRLSFCFEWTMHAQCTLSNARAAPLSTHVEFAREFIARNEQLLCETIDDCWTLRSTGDRGFVAMCRLWMVDKTSIMYVASSDPLIMRRAVLVMAMPDSWRARDAMRRGIKWTMAREVFDDDVWTRLHRAPDAVTTTAHRRAFACISAECNTPLSRLVPEHESAIEREVFASRLITFRTEARIIAEFVGHWWRRVVTRKK